MNSDLNGGTCNPDLAKELKLVTLPRRKPRNPDAIRLSYFDDCSAVTTKPWIMKGLFARGETSSWVAPPGAGKSALMTCAAVHVSANRDWRGFRSKERCGVLYLAFERADLVKRRLAAYAKQGFTNLPIAIGDQIIDLMAPGCIDIILAAIREAEERLGVKIGLIIIDTYAKGIAIGGGDEDKAKDQGKCLGHLRKVQETTNVHIAIVGHTGKDESRGGRGSNAHQADTDVQVQISGDGAVKTAKVIKGNDQPSGVLLQFTMRSEVMGVDEDGDEISVGILSDDEVTAPTQLSSWPRSLTQLFDAISTASFDAGFDHHITTGPIVRAVHLDQVRAIYRRDYVVAPNAKNRDAAVDKALGRALKQARDNHLIGGVEILGRQVIWTT
jgi:AAA domain-containing protein